MDSAYSSKKGTWKPKTAIGLKLFYEMRDLNIELDELRKRVKKLESSKIVNRLLPE